MFEARLVQGVLLKNIIDSIRELVSDGNFDCSSSGLSLQAMDSSHVSLVSLFLRADGFEKFRCDRPLQMGMNLPSLFKMMKCAGSDDMLTIRADDEADSVMFTFEAPSSGRVAEFELKLMSIDSEHLGIPDSNYAAKVSLPSKEYRRICNDLSTIGDTVNILVTKDGIKFATNGDIGKGEIMVRHDPSTDKEEERCIVELQDEPVSLTFALRYLNQFAKATPLASHVVLQLSSELPIVVEYVIEDVGHIRFYLAPKVDDNAEGDE